MGILFSTALVLVFLYFFLFKVLKLLDQPATATLHHRDSKYNRSILSLCSILTKPYIPIRLWGHNGHIQSCIYAVVGRFNAPRPEGKRITIPRPDGATFTFDLFEPSKPHPQGADATLCVCPGLINHSENAYVRTFTHWAMSQGFRVAVLNHLGALPTVPLTSPRVFNYGETGEYAAMVDFIKEHFASSKKISVGFSMGANIVIKYLGEEPSRQDDFICCISVCQGYDGKVTFRLVHEWESMRRFYNFMMTLNMRRMLRRNFDMLFGEGAQSYWKNRSKAPPCYNIKEVFRSTSLVHLDESMTIKMCDQSSLSDFHKWCSSCSYIFNIKIPLLMLNAEDDPLIPVPENWTPMEYCQKSNCAIYAVTKHGGHLGFFEGGFLKANTVSWVDRMLTQYIDGTLELDKTSHSNGEVHCNGAAAS